MTIMDDLYTELAGNSTVVDVIGRDSDGKPNIYGGGWAPTEDDQGKALEQYAVMTRISATHEHDMSGGSELATTTVQLQSWAKDTPQARAMSEVLREALSGISGATWSGRHIGAVHLLLEVDTVEQPTDSSEAPMFSVSQDFQIWHEETASPV